MKIVIRALALGMLVTGFAATQMVASKAAPASSTAIVASASAAPAPWCEPGGGRTCGMFGSRK